MYEASKCDYFPSFEIQIALKFSDEKKLAKNRFSDSGSENIKYG